ncbi:ACT domain protein [Gardnerella pickettii]|nr:ACT domain protein [Gardnerella pickettii]
MANTIANKMTNVDIRSTMGDLFPDLGPETPVISGVAHDRSESMITLRGVPDKPGNAAKVFTTLATANVNIDMIAQASASTETADISLTAPSSALDAVCKVLQGTRGELQFTSMDVDPSVGKVAVVGVGMKTYSGLAATFFTALSNHGINILMISTSEIRIAAIVPVKQLDEAVRALHTAYGLDASKVEAVVYGGSGR